MRILKILSLIFFIHTTAVAQNDNLQVKLDSILEEADLLYRYEKAAWHGSDLFMADAELREDYGGYVIYHSSDTVYATFVDKSQKRHVARYSFTTNELEKPNATDTTKRPLSAIEKQLLDIKLKVLNQLRNPKYEVGIPEGYNPNLVLFKRDNGYRMYVIMGTAASNVIPFGNDYLFETDLEGEIVKWKKYHSRVIPAETQLDGGRTVVSAVHSHLKTTPLITATDICTFRLYGPMYGLNEFQVLSTSLNKVFTYKSDTDSVEVTDL